MSELTKLLFIVIVSNAGGEGKTMLAQLLQGLLQLADEPVIMLDGDAGNQAAKVADTSAKVVGWGVGSIKAPDILAATRNANVILDLGANSLASQREIVDLLPALAREYAQAGYRTVAFLPVSTNKIGAVDAIKALGPKIEGFEKLFVKIDRDGSSVFGGTLEGDNVVKVEHLWPGLQAYVRRPGQTIASSVSHPDPGFNLAAARVAGWMQSFAGQGPIIELLGRNATAIHRYVRPLDALRFSVSSLDRANDIALADNARKSRILNAIELAGFTAEGLRKVAALLDSQSL